MNGSVSSKEEGFLGFSRWCGGVLGTIFEVAVESGESAEVICIRA